MKLNRKNTLQIIKDNPTQPYTLHYDGYINIWMFLIPVLYDYLKRTTENQGLSDRIISLDSGSRTFK